jgi:hypothetical protein
MFYLELENTLTTVLYLQGKPAAGHLFSYFREAQHFFVIRTEPSPTILDYGGISKDQIKSLMDSKEIFKESSGEFSYKFQETNYLGIYKKIPEQHNIIVAIGVSKSQFSKRHLVGVAQD